MMQTPVKGMASAVDPYESSSPMYAISVMNRDTGVGIDQRDNNLFLTRRAPTRIATRKFWTRYVRVVSVMRTRLEIGTDIDVGISGIIRKSARSLVEQFGRIADITAARWATSLATAHDQEWAHNIYEAHQYRRQTLKVKPNGKSRSDDSVLQETHHHNHQRRDVDQVKTMIQSF
jgi:hypothetical protein